MFCNRITNNTTKKWTKLNELDWHVSLCQMSSIPKGFTLVQVCIIQITPLLRMHTCMYIVFCMFASSTVVPFQHIIKNCIDNTCKGIKYYLGWRLIRNKDKKKNCTNWRRIFKVILCFPFLHWRLMRLQYDEVLTTSRNSLTHYNVK